MYIYKNIYFKELTRDYGGWPVQNLHGGPAGWRYREKPTLQLKSKSYHSKDPEKGQCCSSSVKAVRLGAQEGADVAVQAQKPSYALFFLSQRR